MLGHMSTPSITQKYAVWQRRAHSSRQLEVAHSVEPSNWSTIVERPMARMAWKRLGYRWASAGGRTARKQEVSAEEVDALDQRRCKLAGCNCCSWTCARGQFFSRCCHVYRLHKQMWARQAVGGSAGPLAADAATEAEAGLDHLQCIHQCV